MLKVLKVKVETLPLNFTFCPRHTETLLIDKHFLHVRVLLHVDRELSPIFLGKSNGHPDSEAHYLLVDLHSDYFVCKIVKRIVGHRFLDRRNIPSNVHCGVRLPCELEISYP